jgi:hypothetical protein
VVLEYMPGKMDKTCRSQVAVVAVAVGVIKAAMAVRLPVTTATVVLEPTEYHIPPTALSLRAQGVFRATSDKVTTTIDRDTAAKEGRPDSLGAEESADS